MSSIAMISSPLQGHPEDKQEAAQDNSLVLGQPTFHVDPRETLGHGAPSWTLSLSQGTSSYLSSLHPFPLPSPSSQESSGHDGHGQLSSVGLQ